MILSFETFNFSCYEKSSIGLEIKEHFNLLFLANLRIQFCTEGKRPFFEEHVCCLRRPFAVHEYREKYSGLKKAIVIEPGGGGGTSTQNRRGCSPEKLKRTPKRYQYLVLSAWGEKLFTSRRYRNSFRCGPFKSLTLREEPKALFSP